jgi:hypothetical protein
MSTRGHRHTRDQWDAGLRLIDRMSAHTFAVDPGLDRPESFDIGMLWTYIKALVEAERVLGDFLAGVSGLQVRLTQVVWTYYDEDGNPVLRFDRGREYSGTEG